MNDKKQIEGRQELLNIFAPSSLSFEEANILTDKIIETGYRKQSEGEWVLEKEPSGKAYCFHCTVCDDEFRRIDIKIKYPYCPYCGAKMKGGAE